MIGIYEILSEVLGKTFIFKGLVMMIITLAFALLITRNTKKLSFIAISIATGIYFMGVQPSFVFILLLGIFWMTAIWSNEADSRLIEANN